MSVYFIQLHVITEWFQEGAAMIQSWSRDARHCEAGRDKTSIYLYSYLAIYGIIRLTAFV